jgi:hypothetical protein
MFLDVRHGFQPFFGDIFTTAEANAVFAAFNTDQSFF